MVSALGSCYLSPEGQGLKMFRSVVGRRKPAHIGGRSWSSHTSPGSRIQRRNGFQTGDLWKELVLFPLRLLRV